MTTKQLIQDQLDKQRRRVDVDHYDLTVREVVRMAWDGELQRAPAYQRQFRWDESKESRLIESVFLGLPVPSIFVATNKDGTWELVDGLQRVSTLMHFAATDEGDLDELGKDSPLRLKGLETLTELNGRTIKDLPKPIQLAYLKRPLRVTALSDKSDFEVRFEMFERLNSGLGFLSGLTIQASQSIWLLTA